ncbi:anaerobic sulfite reductase subunit AsrA [Anaeromicrobium sediminis]|uniref:Anaerobic sulfite reductase subunit A n=1 Tax=Anaeromicrobium sediminis TaxID=1478221 RepID=A0A267MK78_9FIRM|nr:anaerobic sulfite reductase subunit AsrA [Anaeromicrobium sediminis]PAB59979.1 anaerobic sulfite reductase subunit A [Anaeromicrobium sediminis]
MGLKMNYKEFNNALEELSRNYKIYAPINMNGKGRFSGTDVVGYGEINKIEDAVFGLKSYYSPKEIVFPIRQTLFYFGDDEVKEPKVDDKDTIILLRPCDINGIERLDSIFLHNGTYEDIYYKKLRDKVKFFMIECAEGFDTCFCVAMKANKTDNYSVGMRVKNGEIYLHIKDKDLEEVFGNLGDEVDFKPDFIEKNKIEVNVPDPEKLTIDIFEHEVWKEYDERCIACGRCNTSCITCSCFTMQDVFYDSNQKVGERRRAWTGCHVDGFTDMAGGHSFRQKNGARMRFKTLHKVSDFHKRFGCNMTVGCGRCDDVCPQYISLSKCINKLYDIVEGGPKNE